MDDDIKELKGMDHTALIIIDSIYNATKSIRAVNAAEVDFFIIHRIDLMDLSLSKRIRGSQVKAYLSMISPKILRGANFIVTSCQVEYTIREISDKYIYLKTKQ